MSVLRSMLPPQIGAGYITSPDIENRSQNSYITLMSAMDAPIISSWGFADTSGNKRTQNESMSVRAAFHTFISCSDSSKYAPDESP